MKIKIISIGKTKEKYLLEGIAIYTKRLKHYASVEVVELRDVKHVGNSNQLKIAEGKSFLEQIAKTDHVILLDERGKSKTSVEFASMIEQHQVYQSSDLVFVIGGAYGFSEEMYDRANGKLTLSAMTFSHQMIRLFFVEQLYRAYTIIKNEKYHNQ